MSHPFNLWLVLLTAFVFFAILALFNFVLAVYNYSLNIKPESKTSNTQEIWATLGFAVLWTILTVIIYLYAFNTGRLNATPEETFNEALDAEIGS